MARMSDEEGADYRRSLYSLSRDAKVNEIYVETEKRLMELLRKQVGHSKEPERVEAFMGEAMAILVEANVALDRLEQGRPQ